MSFVVSWFICVCSGGGGGVGGGGLWGREGGTAGGGGGAKVIGADPIKGAHFEFNSIVSAPIQRWPADGASLRLLPASGSLGDPSSITPMLTRRS